MVSRECYFHLQERSVLVGVQSIHNYVKICMWKPECGTDNTLFIYFGNVACFL